ncbi:MAG TPA: hypothetical protein VMS76_02780 [Planctomycetota bacterium]|nr:hypothetical protein [Planctomycetota bacterium]
MSAFAYGRLTREQEQVSSAADSGRDDRKTIFAYVAALAAVIPAEILALHGLIVAATTATTIDGQGATTTAVVARDLLSWSFLGLLVLSVILTAGGLGRLRPKGPADVLRFVLPALAFVGWTMLQRATAFDAVAPWLDSRTRTVVGLFLAALVLFVATRLADPRAR